MEFIRGCVKSYKALEPHGKLGFWVITVFVLQIFFGAWGTIPS